MVLQKYPQGKGCLLIVAYWNQSARTIPLKFQNMAIPSFCPHENDGGTTGNNNLIAWRYGCWEYHDAPFAWD
jgi:hypothetical protein